MFTQSPTMNVYSSFTHNSQKPDTDCACGPRRFRSVRLSATPWAVVCQAPLSVGFSRQESWTAFPCPPPGDLPDPGLNPRFLCLPPWQLLGLGIIHINLTHPGCQCPMLLGLWPCNSHLSFRHHVSLSLPFFLNLNVPASLLQSSWGFHLSYLQNPG